MNYIRYDQVIVQIKAGVLSADDMKFTQAGANCTAVVGGALRVTFKDRREWLKYMRKLPQMLRSRIPYCHIYLRQYADGTVTPTMTHDTLWAKPPGKHEGVRKSYNPTLREKRYPDGTVTSVIR